MQSVYNEKQGTKTKTKNRRSTGVTCIEKNIKKKKQKIFLTSECLKFFFSH